MSSMGHRRKLLRKYKLKMIDDTYDMLVVVVAIITM